MNTHRFHLLQDWDPNHESLFPIETDYDWTQMVYDGVEDESPPNAPPPKGQPIQTSTLVDANLLHCMVTGCSMSSIIHFLNQVPIEWFCKHQNTMETATHGSEFVAAHQACEQIIAL